jgi:hypothetical protein
LLWVYSWLRFVLQRSVSFYLAPCHINEAARMKIGDRTRGIGLAILAAGLFGASTPFSKLLLGQIEPLLLAGLLYLGSGIGLTLWLATRRLMIKATARETGLHRHDLPWLAAAILAGGIVAPILLMLG